MQSRAGLLIAGALFIGSSLVPCALAQTPTPAPTPTPGQDAAQAAPAQGGDTLEVPAGTKVLLALQTAIDTRTAKAGDGVYLQSTFPVMVNGRLAIPPGVFVQGVINKVTRPGKVKGRAAVSLYFTNLIFQNGTQVFIPGNVDRVPGTSGAEAKGSEGTIQQAPTKGKDAQTVANDAGYGAGMGALVGASQGSVGAGAGYGALAGGAAGLIYTMFARGNDIVLPQGQSIEMVLQRPLTVKVADVQAPSTANQVVPVATPVQPATQPLPKPQN